MTPQQTANILAKMAVYDSRNVSEMDVMAWHEIIGHLDYDAAQSAVQAFYTEHAERRAMPADIRKLATDYQARRRGVAERHQRQIDTAPRGEMSRTGAAMCAYVLQKLRASGQNIAAGKHLGVQRAGDIAEAACQEWLEQTAEIP